MASVPPRLLEKLAELDAQYVELERALVDPETLVDHRAVRTLSMKRAALDPVVQDYRAYRRAEKDITELEAVISENEDPELAELARAELPDRRDEAAALVDSMLKRLVTADDRSIASVILEIRAGVGGDEAGIWAGDLLNMYQRFAAEQGWKVEELDVAPADQGGFKQAIVAVTGEAVWAHLGYESGTHQVKRVPATEAQGRIHTSTATVAVLPEPEEVEVDLDSSDVKEMITTSQGPGGQNVNKVATAVHLIHEPTGIEVRMQETKSQAQNRERAWKLLRARLYERQKAEQDAARSEHRRGLIGSGNRAEKIRTYRYKDNLVVDHRIGRSFNLSEVMAGRMGAMIEELVEHDTAERIAAL